MQVSFVSIVSLGIQWALSSCLHSVPCSGALQDKCSELAECLAQALQRFIFFCIEIYRSPLHHVPHLLSLWVWQRLEGCGWSHSGSAPWATAKPAWEQAAAPQAPHILFLLCNYGYGKTGFRHFQSSSVIAMKGSRAQVKKKSPVLIWCSKDLLGENPNSSVNLLPLSISLHNIAGIREFYDFLKILHKYQQHNFI